MELDKVRPRVLSGEQLGEGALLALLETAASGVWLLRVPGGELFWSRRLAETFGFDLDRDSEVPDLIELTHPDDRDRHQATLSRSMETADDYEIEVRMLKRDGALLWLHAHGCWLKDDDGQPTALIGYVQDVSTGAQVRAALKRSEDRFQAFFNQAPAAVFIKNKDSQHIYGNEMAAKLAGTSLERFLNATGFELFTPEVAERIDEVDKRVLHEGKTVTYTGPLDTASGELRHVYDVKFPVEDTKTGERLVGGFGIDITELTHMRQRLADAQRLESVGLLASGIAHDFNNLIFAISGNAELALQSADEEGRELLQAIRTAADHAAALCSQLLAVGGKTGATDESIDVAAVIQDSRGLFDMTLQSKCHLVYEVADDTAHVCIEASLLRQIFVNLLMNAVQASEPGCKITLGACNVTRSETSEPGGYLHSWLPDDAKQLVCIYVEDSGHGIERDALNRVIEPYFTGKEQGHGLGLAAVAGIVKTNNGELQIDSEAGERTRFSCLFPAETPRPRETVDAQGNGTGRRFRSAVVIDDNAAILEITASMLSRLGITVDAFASGLSAIERVTTGTAVDFIISDISMPEISGFVLLEKIREFNPTIPVIMASGYHDNALATESDDRTWFLQKPWSLADLQKVLDEIAKAVP